MGRCERAEVGELRLEVRRQRLGGRMGANLSNNGFADSLQKGRAQEREETGDDTISEK